MRHKRRWQKLKPCRQGLPALWPILGGITAAHLTIAGIAAAAPAEKVQYAVPISTRLNATGRTVAFTVPLLDIGSPLGDVAIQITAADEILIEKKSLADALSAEIGPSLRHAIDAAPEHAGFVPIESFGSIGLDLHFDTGLQELEITLTPEQRPASDLNFGGLLRQRRSGELAQPAFMTGYLNIFAALDRLWNGGSETSRCAGRQHWSPQSRRSAAIHGIIAVKPMSRWMARTWLVALSVLPASPVRALCDVNAGSVSISPVSASTGTYTPPTSPAGQSVTLTVSGTYTSLLGGMCTISVAFNRPSLPASMARAGGGATLAYAIQSAPGGGSQFLYSGAGIPTNRLVQTFSSVVLGLARPFSVNLPTVYVEAQPASPQREGSYAETIAAHFFNGTGGSVADIGSQSFSVNGTVAKSCTIGGVSMPSADAMTVSVGAAGIVNPSTISNAYFGAQCNALTNLQITSLGGAIKRTTAAASGFTNLINYSASATYAGATSTLNTATIATATGAEAGTAGQTSASTSSGTISLAITPQATTQPLVPGSYLDTLRITLTPQ